MNLLKRELAPILASAWKQIDEEAHRVLTLNLAGRKVVDFDGPHGWTFAAVNPGRLELIEATPVTGVCAGLRRVQPLIELRTPILLDLLELDHAGRGASNLALDSVVEAAERIAKAEDTAIFHGFAPGGIEGILPKSPHASLPLSSDPTSFPRAVVEAREILSQAGVNGPYSLVLGPQAHAQVSQAADDGYPIRKRLEQMLDGGIVRAPVLAGALLVSTRGGDFSLTVGQDLSIGFAHRDEHRVELYLTESFTFRVLEPSAAVYLRYDER